MCSFLVFLLNLLENAIAIFRIVFQSITRKVASKWKMIAEWMAKVVLQPFESLKKNSIFPFQFVFASHEYVHSTILLIYKIQIQHFHYVSDKMSKWNRFWCNSSELTHSISSVLFYSFDWWSLFCYEFSLIKSISWFYPHIFHTLIKNVQFRLKLIEIFPSNGNPEFEFGLSIIQLMIIGALFSFIHRQKDIKIGCICMNIYETYTVANVNY